MANTLTNRQEADRDRDLGTGRGSSQQRHGRLITGSTTAGLIRGLESFTLPKGRRSTSTSRWTPKARSPARRGAEKLARSRHPRPDQHPVRRAGGRGEDRACRPDRDHLASCRSTRAAYVQDFLKKQRRASVLPDDLWRVTPSRFRLPTPRSPRSSRRSAPTGTRLYLGKSTAAQVASCAGLRTSGCVPSTARLWNGTPGGRSSRPRGSPRLRRRSRGWPRNCARVTAQLGVVTGGIVEKFAARLGLTGPQAAQAVERAGLKLVDRALTAGIRADRRLHRACSRACRSAA